MAPVGDDERAVRDNNDGIDSHPDEFFDVRDLGSIARLCGSHHDNTTELFDRTHEDVSIFLPARGVERIDRKANNGVFPAGLR